MLWQWFPKWTLGIALIIYGPALIFVQTHLLESWAQWLTSVIFWILTLVVVFAGVIPFAINIFRDPREPWIIFLQYVDFYFALLHVSAGLGMSIWILDSSPNKDAWLLPIDINASPYAIYVGDFLLSAALIFNTVGFVTLQPRPSTVLGSLWAMVVSIGGVAYLMVLLAIVIRNLKKTIPMSEKTMEQTRQIRGISTPLVRADYASVYYPNQAKKATHIQLRRK